MHMVDALRARRWPGSPRPWRWRPSTGGSPSTGSTSCSAGSSPGARAKLFAGEEFTVAVVPSDADQRWVLGVGPKLTVAAGDGSGADATLAGTSAALYLALWNRGDEVSAAGRPDVLERWRDDTG